MAEALAEPAVGRAESGFGIEWRTALSIARTKSSFGSAGSCRMTPPDMMNPN